MVNSEDSLKGGYLISSQTIENFYGKYKVDSYIKALPDTRVKQCHIIYDIDIENNTCPLNFDERAFRCLAVNIDIENWDIYYFEPNKREYHLLDSRLFPKRFTTNSILGRVKTWFDS